MRIDGACVGDGTAISSVATRAVWKQLGKQTFTASEKNASAALGSVVVEQQRLQRLPQTVDHRQLGI